jgi:hypothetical protein
MFDDKLKKREVKFRAFYVFNLKIVNYFISISNGNSIIF